MAGREINKSDSQRVRKAKRNPAPAVKIGTLDSIENHRIQSPVSAAGVDNIIIGEGSERKPISKSTFGSKIARAHEILAAAEIEASKDKKWTMPSGLKDQEAYKGYLALKELLDTSPDLVLYRTSDPNTTVNITSSTFRIRNKIKHLPKEEQDDILTRHIEFCSVKSKMMVLKRQAFGVTKWSDQYIASLDPKRAELIEMFGRFHTTSEVHKIVNNEWGYRLSFEVVQAFRKRHAEAIKRRQDEYVAEYSDIRLGYKRSRLEELTYLYHTRKLKYKEESRFGIPDGREMRNILEQIRKEIEGDKLTIDGDIKVQTDQRIELHVYTQLMNDVSIKNLILARVAARLNVSALKLMDRLTKSYYAKYAGFIRNEDEDRDNVLYPSRVVYNFEELSKIADQKKLYVETAVEEEKIETDEIKKINNLKEFLTKRIIESRRSVASNNEGGKE